MRDYIGKGYAYFTNDVGHMLLREGDLPFVRKLPSLIHLSSLLPCMYMYLVGLVEHICVSHNEPLPEYFADDYDSKLPTLLYPDSISAEAKVMGNVSYTRALEKAMPEFLKHNIVVLSVRSNL